MSDSIALVERRIRDAAVELERSVKHLSFCVRHCVLPAWVKTSDDVVLEGGAAREHAAALYSHILYKSDQRATHVSTAVGAVGADSRICDAAQAANIAKEKFRAAVLALRQATGSNTGTVTPRANQVIVRHRAITNALAPEGFARMHLVQAYRPIALLQPSVRFIGFARRSSAVRIKRFTLEDCRHFGGDISGRIEAALHSLPDWQNHYEIVQRRELNSQVMANVAYFSGERRCLSAPMPLVVPIASPEQFPVHTGERITFSGGKIVKPTRKGRNDRQMFNPIVAEFSIYVVPKERRTRTPADSGIAQ